MAVRTAHLGLGSNLGDRLATIESAVWALDECDGIEVVDVSGVYETAPWGGVDQDPFLNTVVAIATTLTAEQLLAECQLTEAAYGRDRGSEVRWGPRPLDIDILLYGDATIDLPELQVPHPRIAERAFVLIPLMEVMPGGSLPDGTRLTALASALAPLEGIDLFVRLADVPGRQPLVRPAGPSGPGAVMSGDWIPPVGPADGTER